MLEGVKSFQFLNLPTVLKVKMRLYFIVVFLFYCVVAHANYITWQSDYETARKQAQNNHKNILVFLIEEDSKRSNKIIQESFLNQNYIETIDENFVAVIVRARSKKSYPIELLYTTTYPALFFLSAEELFLCDALEGVITPSKVRQKLLECH